MQPSRYAAEDGQCEGAPALPDRDDAAERRLAALRARGAHQMDPGRFRYLEALVRRARAYDGSVRRMLDERLAQALAAYGSQYDAAVRELDQFVFVVSLRYPQAEKDLKRLHADGNARAVHTFAARLDAEATRSSGGPLADLVRHIEGHNAVPALAHESRTQAAPSGAASSLGELKAVHRFRDTWTRLRIDQQLTRSQQKAPDNPGPLNSHLLVLRALRRMQDLSPAYLERFMAHVDALLWLDGAAARPSSAYDKSLARKRDRRKG